MELVLSCLVLPAVDAHLRLLFRVNVLFVVSSPFSFCFPPWGLRASRKVDTYVFGFLSSWSIFQSRVTGRQLLICKSCSFPPVDIILFCLLYELEIMCNFLVLSVFMHLLKSWQRERLFSLCATVHVQEKGRLIRRPIKNTDVLPPLALCTEKWDGKREEKEMCGRGKTFNLKTNRNRQDKERIKKQKKRVNWVQSYL